MDNTRKERCWGKSMNIYASHAMSSWGDRMWSFAVGLYLVVLFPESLQLTAIYGFLSCVSAIFLGAFIGKWVDRTERLKAAQTSLLLQNAMVITCAALLIVHLYYTDEMSTVLEGALGVVVISFVILFAIISNLASIATKLVLEKDWIVVLCGGNEALLSKMNSTMRTIDLTTFILAPILVGQIFTYGSHIIGAVCIAGWNILSGGVEYYLLNVIYKSTPELNKEVKPLPTFQIESPRSVALETLTNNNNPEPKNPANTPISLSPSIHDGIAFENLSEISLVTPKSQRFQLAGSENEKPKKSVIQKNIFSLKIKIQESRIGWKDYFSHPVRNAGLGLAFLYMTVLGFDSITTGYAYSQGVSESILGVLTAAGAVFGILGSLSFPFFRKKLGKLVTGNLGFGAETICLVLCLVSIVTSGSPFKHKDKVSFGESTDECPENFTRLEFAEGNNRSLSVWELWNCNISVILFLAGIVSARFGLWIADLSVVQIFQERVSEDQRGVLNGVQASLNQSMNLVKFLIVIVLPKPATFAYLIIASWLFVFSGWAFFMFYAWRNRLKHILPRYSANIPTVSEIVDDKGENGNEQIESGLL